MRSSQLEAELVTGEQSLQRLEADRAQLAEAQERRASLDIQLSRQQADLAVARRAEALISQRDDAQSRYDRLKRATELVEEADRLSHEMPTDVPLTVLRTTVNRVTTLSFEVSEVEAEIGAGQSTDTEVGEPALAPAHPLARGRHRSHRRCGGVLAPAGWGGWRHPRGRPRAGGSGDARPGRSRSRSAAASTAWPCSSQRMLRRAGWRPTPSSRSASGVGGASSKRCSARSAWPTSAPPRSSSRASSSTPTASPTSRVSCAGMGVEDRNLRRLGEARDEAADATEQARHALAGMGEAAEDPRAAGRRLERLAEQTQLARDRARSEEDQARGRVDANLVDAEIVAGLAERCAAARARETELVRRLRIYEATRQAIDHAEQATLKTAARYLEEHMGPAVARITDGSLRRGPGR